MSKVIVTEQHLADIAAAIRSKNGAIDTYTPAQMATAISAIEGSANDWGCTVINPEHTTITAMPRGTLTTLPNGRYLPGFDVDCVVSADTGWAPGTLRKTVDQSTRTITVTATEATQAQEPVSNLYLGVDGWFYSDPGYTQVVTESFEFVDVIGMQDPSYNINNWHLPANCFILQNNIVTKIACENTLSNESTLAIFISISLTELAAGPLSNNDNLMGLHLPVLQAVEANCFCNNPRLEQVVLGAQIILPSALVNCPRMARLGLTANTVVSFPGAQTILPSHCNIYVPAELINAYQASEDWSSFEIVDIQNLPGII